MSTSFDLDVMDTFLKVVSFIVGGMVGSFLNVCVHRIPRGMSVVHPRSHCPGCNNPIAWYDNIPVVSWLVLGARCRHCQCLISWQYPLVEALTGLLFLGVSWRFGFTVASPIYMALAASMVLVTFVDLTDWTIPNEVTFPGIPIGLACSVLAMFYPASALIVTDPFNSLAGILLGGGSLYLLDKLTVLLLKKRGMGFGDVKLLAMLGGFVGWKGVLMTIMVASLLGSVVGLTMVAIQKRKADAEEGGGHYLPFGPYLAAAGLLYVFFGNQLLAAYIDLLTVAPSVPEALPLQ